MKADHNSPSPGLHAIRKTRERLSQDIQFVVHGDSQGLKHASGRIDALPHSTGWQSPAHDLCQFFGASNLPFLPRCDDRPCHTSAVTLLAVAIEDLRQYL